VLERGVVPVESLEIMEETSFGVTSYVENSLLMLLECGIIKEIASKECRKFGLVNSMMKTYGRRRYVDECCAANASKRPSLVA